MHSGVQRTALPATRQQVVAAALRQAGPTRCQQAGRRAAPSPACRMHYEKALELARNEEWEAARKAFLDCVNAWPEFEKAWISWSQMEKRSARQQAAAAAAAAASRRDCWPAARAVLQQALTVNRGSPALLQAWGLMELQKGNALAATRLLEMSASCDPRNAPVLRWKAVLEARASLLAMQGQRRSRRAQAH